MKENTPGQPDALTALIEAPRWFFLVLLLFAPLAYGCTERWAIDVLDFAMATILALWLAGAALREVRPSVHPICLACTVFLLVEGWGMTLNAHFRHDVAKHLFTTVTAPFGWLPGTVDRDASLTAMLRITGLLGMGCFAGDLAPRPEWRRRIWWAAGLAGVSVVLLGLAQRASGATMIFWSAKTTTAAFFGPYYYHGNAGSFIILVIPLIAGLAVIAIRDPAAHGRRALWLSSLLLCAAAAFVNVSRSAAAITALLLTVFAAFQIRPFLQAVRLPARQAMLAYAGLALLGLACIVSSAGWESPLQKWMKLGSQLTGDNVRVLATHAGLKMLPDAGFWGLGPGTFEIAFPHYTQFLGDSIPGTWRYLHEDYLQTLIEWGWCGGAAWAVLFLGGIDRCLAVALGKRQFGEEGRLLMFGCGLALLGVALHALVDFPLQIASLQLYAATYLGLGWGFMKPVRARPGVAPD